MPLLIVRVSSLTAITIRHRLRRIQERIATWLSRLQDRMIASRAQQTNLIACSARCARARQLGR
jgi:hypothetical protein